MNDLKHFGILGMKWGRRKANNSSETGTKKSKVSDDFLKTKQLRKKKLNQLSNEELRALNNRMQLERQYKDLTQKDISKGKKWVSDALGKIGSQAINTIVTKFVEGMASDFASRYGPGANRSSSNSVVDLKFLKD